MRKPWNPSAHCNCRRSCFFRLRLRSGFVVWIPTKKQNESLRAMKIVNFGHVERFLMTCILSCPHISFCGVESCLWVAVCPTWMLPELALPAMAVPVPFDHHIKPILWTYSTCIICTYPISNHIDCDVTPLFSNIWCKRQKSKDTHTITWIKYTNYMEVS